MVENGKTTIINLKGVPPDIQQLIVKRLATFMFELRKKGSIPPMMFVVEEAHNYCPQAEHVMSSKPLATIASEGRKFGLGLMVISDDIQSMPIGMAMVVGAGIESPLLVEVRPRESRHGGAGVKILGDD